MKMSDEKIRCFIAVDFPREITEEIKRIQKEIEKKNLFHGKFTEPENLHLTLKFLGEIDKEKTEKVKENLREIKIDKFRASLGDLGVFSTHFIKIIWIKILGSDILKLQKLVDDCVSESGFKPEERFMSHLTIARVKSLKNRKLFLQELNKVKPAKLKFDVDCFYLMKSELKPEGAEYSVIERYKL
jgi:2'-5' RNA ligase